jgi:hypothetical protein
VATAELPATSTGAWLLPSTPLILGYRQRHYIGGRTTVLEHVCHGLHCGAGMRKEQLQPGAEVVLTLLAISRERKPVLRTSTVAEEPDFATLTLGGECVALVISELALFGRSDEFEHVSLMNIAELELWLDEMVAGVEIAIVFQRGPIAAGRGVNTQQVPAEIGLKGNVKELNVNPSYVVTYPLLEDIDEELTVLFPADCAIRDQVAGLSVEQTLVIGAVAPAKVGDLDSVGVSPLYDWDELHPLGVEFISEEAVDRPAMLLVSSIDRA